ncbi:pro-adrenomedullin [Oreochromis aureus]|nr:pro-adrenomedullin [Oreochromis aureus]
MRLFLHTIICCCVFTTVLPLVKGARGETNTSLRKRSRVWLQSHMKRDLRSRLVTGDDQYFSGPQQDRLAKTLPTPSSFGLNIRSRRSTSSQSGCFLITCIYHDLFHRLVQIKKNEKTDTTAPTSKIGRNGYGRRRRSLLDATQLVLETGTHRWSTETGQRVSNTKSTHTVA